MKSIKIKLRSPIVLKLVAKQNIELKA